jgi:polyhydroxybutyrate depolymerase
MTWTIEGVTREALVHIPTGGVGAAPVMFAFHGHGGTDLGFAERGFEINWPEAIVVYPQGLPTISNSDKTGRGNGWQHSVGEVNNHTGVKDQDLKFFDAMLATLDDAYHGDSHLVFAHGWSNGGEFVYDALWAARGDKLTALAPAAATLGTTSGKRPMPVIHVAGTSDPHVHFSNQQKSVQGDRTVNSCSDAGTTWAKGAGGLLGTQYASATNNQVVLLQYNGGHAYPFTVPPYIVQFFKDAAGL